MKLLEALQWRYATKKYDSSKKVPTDKIDQIKKAIQYAPTSYGLQLFEVIDVQDVSLRKKLRQVAFGQPQVTDADRFFVFCHRSEFMREDVQAYIDRKAKAEKVTISSLQSSGDAIFSALKEKSPIAQKQWMARQVYIALGHGIVACALYNIDASPMEGFDSDAFDELLGLKEKGLCSVVSLGIGYRSTSDSAQFATKVRKSLSDLFTEL